MRRFNPRTRHSHAFYQGVLRIVVPGLLQGRGYETIRALLAASDYPSPTGGPWTLPALNGIIARMRKRTGFFYTSLLEMFLAGDITRNEVATVLRSQ
jgi:hypothetical protein